jgi:hypothetical protein
MHSERVDGSTLYRERVDWLHREIVDGRPLHRERVEGRPLHRERESKGGPSTERESKGAPPTESECLYSTERERVD